MDYICPHCGLEYHIMEEYIATYKEEGKRCGCGEIMILAPEKVQYDI